MRTKATAAILVSLVLLGGIPALAGGGHGCKAGTQDCLDKMAADMKGKGLIGVDGEWDEVAEGFRVESLIPGTNAEHAGVRIGDVLMAVNGIPLKEEAATKADRENRRPGANVSIVVLREGERKMMNVTLSAMTEEQMARYVGAHMLEHAVVARND